MKQKKKAKPDTHSVMLLYTTCHVFMKQREGRQVKQESEKARKREREKRRERKKERNGGMFRMCTMIVTLCMCVPSLSSTCETPRNRKCNPYVHARKYGNMTCFSPYRTTSLRLPNGSSYTVVHDSHWDFPSCYHTVKR